jgi:glycosyltransferase involved in cell wall biosynthesis
MTTSPTATSRVVLLSPIGTSINPYIGLLRDGLAAAGAQVRLVERLDVAAFASDQRPDVIHVHWLDRYDVPPAVVFLGLHGATDLPRRAARRGLETVCNLPLVYAVRRWLRLRRLLAQLSHFQKSGGRVAYTVHNVEAHEGENPADRWGTARLIQLADVVHVHDASTAEAVAARFGRRTGVVVIPHGHYIDSYPNTVSRAAARGRLGLPDGAFVYLALGLLRPYKGLEELIPAFRSLPADDAVLLMAGIPSPADYAQALHELAGGDARIRLIPRFVPPEDVQLYLNAADICVLPYRQITTSGAAVLALSFGVPVLAPAIGAFPHLLAQGRGILYNPGEAHSLAQALAQARTRAWRSAPAEIIAWTRQFGWTEIGRTLLAAYRTFERWNV